MPFLLIWAFYQIQNLNLVSNRCIPTVMPVACFESTSQTDVPYWFANPPKTRLPAPENYATAIALPGQFFLGLLLLSRFGLADRSRLASLLGLGDRRVGLSLFLGLSAR